MYGSGYNIKAVECIDVGVCVVAGRLSNPGLRVCLLCLLLLALLFKKFPQKLLLLLLPHSHFHSSAGAASEGTVAVVMA